MANLIKTPNKAISCVSGESTKELEEIGKAFDIAVRNIILGSAEKLAVLNIVLREMMKLKLKPNQKISFDFGGKKVFELKRSK